MQRRKELWRGPIAVQGVSSADAGIDTPFVLDAMELCRKACVQVAEFQKAALVKSYSR
jgi:hypothetical protein